MKRITITKTTGEKIAAWLGLPSNSQYLLIVCHGFLGAKENQGRIFTFAAALNDRGIGVLAFDFVGSGESNGEFSSVTLSRQADDLQRVIGYVEKELRLPIILLGRSFGGSTIIAMPEHAPTIKGYVFWSAPLDLPATFRKVLGEWYDELESGRAITVSAGNHSQTLLPDLVWDFNKLDLKQNLLLLRDKPVLICHGKNDEVVAYTNAVAIHQSLPHSTLKLVEQADHRFTDLIELREQITLEWLQDTFLK